MLTKLRTNCPSTDCCSLWMCVSMDAMFCTFVAVIFYFTYGIHHSKLNDSVSCIRHVQLDEATTALLQQPDDIDDDDGSLWSLWASLAECLPCMWASSEQGRSWTEGSRGLEPSSSNQGDLWVTFSQIWRESGLLALWLQWFTACAVLKSYVVCFGPPSLDKNYWLCPCLRFLLHRLPESGESIFRMWCASFLCNFYSAIAWIL